MRCATCGEILAPGAVRCPTCGAAVAVHVTSVPVERCPRCGYRGEGVGYFGRTGHVAILIVLSLFTYGLGGLVYWLARRKHRICPNCGLGWDRTSRVLTAGDAGASTLPGDDAEEALPSGGVKRRLLGTLMILVAALLLLLGIVEAEQVLLVVGSVHGAAGTGLFYWGWKAQQERRQAVLAGLQRKVLRLATRRGGTLTVTEVAADLSLSIPAAERVLIAMDDGFRVRSEITKEGILLYEFPEVQHRLRLEPGSGGG